MAKTFAKELIRNGAGIAINSDNARIPKRIHHFSHHEGISMVIITEMPANKLENLLGAGEEGIVVQVRDKVVKCFYGDKVPKNKLDYFKACKSGKYKVFPKVERIGKGYVVMEKLEMFTSKCNEYQYVIDKVYWDFVDGTYNIEDYNEQEQEVIHWLEEVKKAIEETTVFADLGDLDEKNFGERADGTIVYFDV